MEAAGKLDEKSETPACTALRGTLRKEAAAGGALTDPRGITRVTLLLLLLLPAVVVLLMLCGC